MSDHKPPLLKAEKVDRSGTNYRVSNGSIAAIDFGTTSVTLAYTTAGDDEISTFSFARKQRVPNAILLKKERNSKILVEAFGETAQTKFSSMKPSEHANYIYFERIKMLMKREKTINRQSLVESFSREQFYLVEVIAFILKHIKDLLIDHLSRTVTPLKTTDFDWVITVPAIWDARGKRMMREAAYLAGLLTESDGISVFTSIGGNLLPLPNEVNFDKLSLALEPESAALYSQEMVVQKIEQDRTGAAIQRSTQYMVIDAGGGTIDITAHIERDDGGIVVENVPTGNAWGGTQVNEAFSKMLQEIIGDPEFSKFLPPDKMSQQMAILSRLIYHEFEEQKLSFGECKTDTIAVEMAKFAKVYEDALEAGTEKMHGVEFVNDILYIERDVVESKLFGPAIDGIVSCTLSAIQDNGCKVDTFYLVGGFGGCKYVYDKVKVAVEQLYHANNRACVVVPPSPTIAVAQGAVIWRRNTDKVKARKADATYGIVLSPVFNDSIHDTHYRYYHDEDKEHRCNWVFSVFLEKGEVADANQVVTTPVRIFNDVDTQMQIEIYSTPTLGVQYIIDKNDEYLVTKAGVLVIDTPNIGNLSKEQRVVDVYMDFSGTEIQAKAKYRVTGKEVHTVCDFLSAQS